MAAEAILRIKVITDSAQAALGLDKASQTSGKFAQSMQKAALPAAAVGAAVVVAGKKALDAASKMQQAGGAVEAVYGDSASAVEKYSKSAARNMGLSAADYQNYAALVGTSLQNAGMSAAEAADESNKAMQRAADLSALYGGTTADAVDAINAAVSRSEFDPLEKYGVSLNMTAVNAELAAKGQDKLTGAALDTAKKQVILEKIYEDTGKAAGQYAREADSVAGRQQTMAAQAEDAAAALGTILLPIVAETTKWLGKMATWAGKNTKTVQIMAGAILALAAAVLVINAALKVYQATMIVVQAVQKATWLSNPIFLVIAAVIALVAAVVILWKRSETFRAVVLGIWSAIKAGAMAVMDAVVAAWKGIISAGRAVWNGISAGFRTAFNIVRGIVLAYFNFYKAIFNGIKAATMVVINFVKREWQRMMTGIKVITSATTRAVTAVFNSVKATLSGIFSAIRRAWDTAINGIKSAVKGLAPLLERPFNGLKIIINAIKDAINGLISTVNSLVSKIRSIKWPTPPKWVTDLGGKIGNLFSASAPQSAARVPAVVRASGAPGVASRGAVVPLVGATASGASVFININGAIDPESTARAVGRVMAGHYRRVGQGAAIRGLRTS